MLLDRQEDPQESQLKSASQMDLNIRRSEDPERLNQLVQSISDPDLCHLIDTLQKFCA
jgi:hypothetical protein